METKHTPTPGPWIARQQFNVGNMPFNPLWGVYIQQEKGLDTVYEQVAENCIEEHAHLFATAPKTAAERDRLSEINADLLEALKACIRSADSDHNTEADSYWRNVSVEVIEQARTVINKVCTTKDICGLAQCPSCANLLPGYRSVGADGIIHIGG